MPQLLIRHASAGDPGAWIGDDRARPLDERGRAQADDLVGTLDPYPLERVLTSPYLRCVETAQPLAASRRLALEYRHELGDDAGALDALALFRELRSGNAALCSHGDLIAELLGEELEKGGVAIVEATAGGLAVLERLRPPA
jgi:phosphohistidine phosphatase SixA